MNELNTRCGLYMKDYPFTTTAGIVNLHPNEGIHWDFYTKKNYIDSYGCPPPLTITKHIIKGICSEYRVQKNDSYCAPYFLYF